MLELVMNDTIMASVAALKSRSQDTSFSLYTGFRSVRGKSTQFSRKLSEIKRVTDDGKERTTIALAIETDVLNKLKASSEDHIAEIRNILRDHVRTRL